MHLRFTLVFFVASCGVGVADDVDDADDAVGVSATGRRETCPYIECGENAATAGDGLLFDELDLFHGANYAGVMMTGATAPTGRAAQIDIWGDELVAKDTAGVEYRGAALIGTVIHFKHISGELFDILVADVLPQSVKYYSGDSDPVPIYDLRARRAGGKKFDFYVCGNERVPVDPTWDIALAHHALVFRGDRYDGVSKTALLNDPTNGWSFIACNGAAATKMHLWRHTYASGFDHLGRPVFMTSLDDRTTLLKAITADYCGTGESLTVTGTPLVFATADDPTSFPFPYAYSSIRSIDAIWKYNGAICLDTPRRAYFGGLSHEGVEAKCGHAIPYCGAGAGSFPPGWNYWSHVITANPTP